MPFSLIYSTEILIIELFTVFVVWRWGP